MIFKKLEWSEVLVKNSTKYYYVISKAKTSFGIIKIFRLESPDTIQFDIEFNDIYISTECKNLAFAKEEAQKLFDSMLLRCFE